MTNEDIVAEMGRLELIRTHGDPMATEVANQITAAMRRFAKTGADNHTVITMMASAIAYSLANGGKAGGFSFEEVRGFVGSAQAVMTFVMRDVFDRGGDPDAVFAAVAAGETVQ